MKMMAIRSIGLEGVFLRIFPRDGMKIYIDSSIMTGIMT